MTCALQNQVGFIGLGNMGAHMARNLMKKNWKVMVYDINKDAVQAAVQDGEQVKLNHVDCRENEMVFTITFLTTDSRQSLCFTGLNFVQIRPSL